MLPHPSLTFHIRIHVSPHFAQEPRSVNMKDTPSFIFTTKRRPSMRPEHAAGELNHITSIYFSYCIFTLWRIAGIRSKTNKWTNEQTNKQTNEWAQHGPTDEWAQQRSTNEWAQQDPTNQWAQERGPNKWMALIRSNEWKGPIKPSQWIGPTWPNTSGLIMMYK